MNALSALRRFKNGGLEVLKKEKWLLYIGLTQERNINLERLSSLEEINRNHVLDYVERTLSLLGGCTISGPLKEIAEEVLKWSEVAKGGLPNMRRKWIEKGYNLYVHNIGSAEIYLEESRGKKSLIEKAVYELVRTHGLIGQYIRGEVALSENRALSDLIEEGLLSRKELEELLGVLNYCIISAVSEDLWNSIRDEVGRVIGIIVKGALEQGYSTKDRIKALRTVSIRNGEDFEEEYGKLLSKPDVCRLMDRILGNCDLWYVEAALYDFSFEEFVKIFMLISGSLDIGKTRHISFENFMKELYYQHDGKKRINIYKKRIIEKYLSGLTPEEIITGHRSGNLHVRHEVSINGDLDDTAFFNFRFSPAGAKLIDFCVEAEKSDIMYEKAVILLFDLFGLRKDKYDRFYEEERYLETMNMSIDYKKIILDHVKGRTVLDMGPGGGAIMDLLEERYPEKKIIGVDIAQNVLDALQKKKQLEKRKWEVLYGDALNLADYVEKESVDTVIFCSILHELFSYIEYNGSRFNYETLAAALKSTFEVLAPGGRIIIRDGIMTEPANQKRIIKFLSEEGIDFLRRYAGDFKGRRINYTIIGQNEVIMPVNDAMEFLYTYTWGEKSYVHEVNEQFGYFTPSGYRDFISRVLGGTARIVEFKHFLQEGYTIALSQKVEFFDEERKPVELPDSTCLIVVEKN